MELFFTNENFIEYVAKPIIQSFWAVLIGTLLVAWLWGKIQSMRLMFALLLEFRRNIVRLQRFKKSGKSLFVVSDDVWSTVKVDKNIMNWLNKCENQPLIKKIENAIDHLRSKRAKAISGEQNEVDWNTVKEKFREAYTALKQVLILHKDKIIWPFCWIPRSKHKLFKIDEI